MIRGVDVSSYQQPSTWEGMHPAFVMIKATEGEHTVDARYADHLRAAVAQRSLPFAYHFGWPIQNPQTEASHFAQTVRADVTAGHVRAAVLDLEPYPDNRNIPKGGGPGGVRDWTAHWRDAVRAQLRGVKVICYADLDVFGRGWVAEGFDAYWIAEYRGGMTYSRAEKSEWPVIGGYPKPLFWQFTASGGLDLDLCSLEDPVALSRWLGGGAPAPAPPAKPAPAQTYTVRWGDTMSGIAAAHGVSLADLEHANPQVRNPDVIITGQVLHLPAGARQLPRSTQYRVRKGDTMSGIAAAHGVSLTALERANPQVRNPNMIMIGQSLTIPARP